MDGAIPSPQQPTELALRPFADGWAARLITYKRDGSAVSTSVNMAVLGNELVFRTYASAWKCRRVAVDPRVEIAPITFRGKPMGDAIPGAARQLSGDDARAAAQAIDSKYPVFQRGVVRLGHRLLRYQTVHYGIVPSGSHGS